MNPTTHPTTGDRSVASARAATSAPRANHFAISRGYVEDSRDAIFVAAGRGDVRRVALLLDADPSLANARHPEAGGTPLHFAELADQYAVVRLLMARGAEPFAPDLPALATILWHGEK